MNPRRTSQRPRLSLVEAAAAGVTRRVRELHNRSLPHPLRQHTAARMGDHDPADDPLHRPAGFRSGLLAAQKDSPPPVARTAVEQERSV